MRFSLGRIVATPGALETFPHPLLFSCLRRHASGDWGELCEMDKELNDGAVKHGGRVFSSYALQDGKLWIITEADRSATTFLLPEEY